MEARLIFAPVTEMTEDFLREVSLSALVLLYLPLFYYCFTGLIDFLLREVSISAS